MFISVIGRDRPGILAAISRILQDQDCNIENISQTILQSVFGALMIVSIPESLEEQSLKSIILKNLSDPDLDVFVKAYDRVTAAVDTVSSHPFVITTLGPDKPGLVNAITTVFAKYDINVTNLKAVFKGGTDPRDNVMIFEVDMPAETSLPEVRTELQRAAQKLDLDINIQHRKIFETMNRI